MHLNPSKFKQSARPCLNMVARDLRRYGLLPAAALLLFLLFSVIPDLEALQEMQRNNPLQEKLIDLLIAAILPVLSALSVFSWLHDRQLAARFHALPLTRNQHFFSHVISGWILSILPFVILFLIYVGLIDHSAMRLLLATEEDYYNNAYFWMWLTDMLVTVTFVYNLSVLAGILAGTTVVHLLMALFLNGLLPVMVYLINLMVREFWVGFFALPLGSSQLSPVSRQWMSANFRYMDPAVPQLLYTAAAAAILFIAWQLYRKLPLEREGEPTMFKGFGEFVCFCFGFIGLCVGGMLLYSFSYSGDKVLFLIGAAAGGLLFYTAAHLILEKRLHVFYPANLKKLGAYLLCGAVFSLFMIFDLGGFAARLPEASETAAVTVTDVFELDNERSFDDPALLEKARNLGLALAEHGKPGKDADEYDGEIHFTYYLGRDHHPDQTASPAQAQAAGQRDARAVYRYYSFDPAQPDIARAYAALYDDPAYKARSHLYDLTGDTLCEASFVRSQDDFSKGSINDPSYMAALADAIRQDFRSVTYADLLEAREEDKAPVGKLYLIIKYKPDSSAYDSYTLRLYPCYSRTLKLLKELNANF